MSDLIRAIRIAPMPRSSSDEPVRSAPNTYGLWQSQIESQQRQQERLMARSIRAGRQQVPDVSAQPIRLYSPQNFIINMPVN